MKTIVIPGRGFGRSLGLIRTPKTNKWIQNNLFIVYWTTKFKNTMDGWLIHGTRRVDNSHTWSIKSHHLLLSRIRHFLIWNEIFNKPGFLGLGKGSFTGRGLGREGSLGRIRGRILGRGLGLTGAVEVMIKNQKYLEINRVYLIFHVA